MGSKVEFTPRVFAEPFKVGKSKNEETQKSPTTVSVEKDFKNIPLSELSEKGKENKTGKLEKASSRNNNPRKEQRETVSKITKGEKEKGVMIPKPEVDVQELKQKATSLSEGDIDKLKTENIKLLLILSVISSITTYLLIFADTV